MTPTALKDSGAEQQKIRGGTELSQEEQASQGGRSGTLRAGEHGTRRHWALSGLVAVNGAGKLPKDKQR